ncbi:MAG TPA: hypothetical protein VHT02_02115 [Methylocella sp.]|jgi:hypothetical protein|nr:hypothetical protein [Methylocella sp.]
MQTVVFEAFRAIDIPEDKALNAAEALSRGNDQAIKIHENRLAKIEADTASLKIDTAILKWMMGIMLAFQVASFAKLFLH